MASKIWKMYAFSCDPNTNVRRAHKKAIHRTFLQLYVRDATKFFIFAAYERETNRFGMRCSLMYVVRGWGSLLTLSNDAIWGFAHVQRAPYLLSSVFVIILPVHVSGRTVRINCSVRVRNRNVCGHNKYPRTHCVYAHWSLRMCIAR